MLPTLQPNPKETTEKYGLEAGLWQVFRNKDPVTGKSKGQQAKDLLKRYGGAYLITSISFAIVSFAACYALVSAGTRLFSVEDPTCSMSMRLLYYYVMNVFV